VLPVVATFLAGMRIAEGNLDAAATLLDEADAIVAATGNSRGVVGRLVLAASRGDEAQASILEEALERDATARGDGAILTAGEYARALLHNGLGQYEMALAAAQQAIAQDELSITSMALPELVEAAVRSGRPQVAADALEHLSERTRVAGTEFALGIEARSGALTSEGAPAEVLYREAIELLGRTRMRFDLARAHLLYGEWLRRENRRVDARDQLRSAHDLLSSMGADGFAERAARELLATGGKARKRTPGTRGELTAQEAQIAQLAREGYSNPEIGAQLFISPRTVQYHLHKVFTKLEISSRTQLDGALPSETREPQPV
jgi:DNA-binding CsgD family transcriptional regulator